MVKTTRTINNNNNRSSQQTNQKKRCTCSLYTDVPPPSVSEGGRTSVHRLCTCSSLFVNLFEKLLETFQSHVSVTKCCMFSCFCHCLTLSPWWQLTVLINSLKSDPTIFHFSKFFFVVPAIRYTCSCFLYRRNNRRQRKTGN